MIAAISPKGLIPFSFFRLIDLFYVRMYFHLKLLLTMDLHRKYKGAFLVVIINY
jgi:hypothetical protein